MEIVALQEYTDNKISLYEGEIRNIGNNLAQKLIAEGVVAEHSDSGSEGGNDILYVNVGQRTGQTTFKIDKTGKEIVSHASAGKPIIVLQNSGGMVLEYHIYFYAPNSAVYFYCFKIQQGADYVTPTTIKFINASVYNTDDYVINIGEDVQFYPQT